DVGQAIHHHLITGLQTTEHHTTTFVIRTERHLAVLHEVLRIHHVHELAALVRTDRPFGYQDHRFGHRRTHLHVDVEAGGQEPVGVGDDGAGADRAARSVEAVVEGM